MEPIRNASECLLVDSILLTFNSLPAFCKVGYGAAGHWWLRWREGWMLKHWDQNFGESRTIFFGKAWIRHESRNHKKSVILTQAELAPRSRPWLLVDFVHNTRLNSERVGDGDCVLHGFIGTISAPAHESFTFNQLSNSCYFGSVWQVDPAKDMGLSPLNAPNTGWFSDQWSCLTFFGWFSYGYRCRDQLYIDVETSQRLFDQLWQLWDDFFDVI